MKNQEVLYRKQLRKKDSKQEFDLKFEKLPVKKGDFIYFVSNCHENTAHAELSGLNIKLDTLEKK